MRSKAVYASGQYELQMSLPINVATGTDKELFN